MLEKLQSFKELITNFSTGAQRIEDCSEKYLELRQALMSASLYKSEISEWLIECQDINDFWSFIKSKFSTYAERRTFIRRQLAPLFRIAESTQSSLLESK